MEIKKVGIEAIPLIQSIAKSTWAVAYKEIISAQQMDFMLDLMYSTASLQNQLQQKHQFIVAYTEHIPAAFAAYAIKDLGAESIFKLHKIYVLPDQQAKGIGKSLLQFILDDISAKGAKYLQLNVNRQNKAIEFYKKLGFAIVAEVDVPIGNGFFMNDFVMQISC